MANTFLAAEVEGPLRLTEFSIFGLFDNYDYVIPFNTSEHVTAIIAPNGSGKTLCLRFISNFFENKWMIFSETQYARIHFVFSDGSHVTILKPQHAIQIEDAQEDFNFIVRAFNRAGQIVEWEPHLRPKGAVPVFERYLPFFSRLSNDRWRNDQTGEIMRWPEIVESFSDRLPISVRSGAYGKQPELLETIISSIDCRLIETQRLLILGNQASEPAYYRPSVPQKNSLAISQKATLLKNIISEEINKYAALSQSLDRSFPRRVIQQLYRQPPQDLRQQLQDLDGKRSELTEAGILDSEVDEPVALPAGKIDENVVKVLAVYAEDARRKLSSLSQILAKIRLFKSLIDKRFTTKDVRINRQNGIDVFSNEKRVPLEKLSSGEQHQLVLFFEMLFETKNNALILIDEPELSLHVTWQKQFISDIMKIIELNKFDVVLATHSPQLIGRWNDLVVELGDVDEFSKNTKYITE